ncbi:MAG: FAD-dependent catabolic D-arginine dehydrogenase DauA [Burkholderiaceae bacterium]
MKRCDFLVIGAGIAGASAAYELAASGRVLVLERESQPGYHTTGRSAALFTETYGNATMRALTRASKAFLTSPPAGFAPVPLLAPRGTLLAARADQRSALERAFAECSALVGNLERWTGAQVRERVPVFTDAQVDGGLWEPDAMDIDVHALHHGFLRGLRARGGEVVCDAEVIALERAGADWVVETGAERFAAPIVVNAAGAWADEIGRLAGAAPVGLVPKRRTAITFDAPRGVAIERWPAVIDVDERWYFKPDAGRILASPADETPSAPCDAQPDEYDVAVLIDRITTATTLAIPRIHAKWAGLRSFVADKTLVAGFDPRQRGFFWLAGQGGYGIQTAPAAGRVAAALARGEPLPADVQALGVGAGDLAPDRRALRG